MTMSSSRSGRILAARPVFLATRAATQANRFDWLSLPPKPPPIRRTSAVTAEFTVPSTLATSAWASEGCCVEVWTVTSSSSPGIASAIWPSR